MTFIIVTPKFNSANLLEIKINNQSNNNFSQLKLCFSLVYSIKEVEGAKIIKQIGRYYELLLDQSNLGPKQTIALALQLQIPRIGTYNLSCGPEGLFILDTNEKRIELEILQLSFDSIIRQPQYEAVSGDINDNVIPELRKTKFSNQHLSVPQNNFVTEDVKILEICKFLKPTCDLLSINFFSAGGAHIKFQSMELEKDEYRINISQNGITIYANDYGGRFYAIITLIHLISYYDYKLPLGEIEDSPYFKWRGMHLDCSRQFHTVEQIKRLLIYMGMFKLNRFHWHLTDNEAWRLDLKCYPNLARQSSFRGYKQLIPPLYGSGCEKSGGYYSNEEVKDIIAFAKKLNIEVMPEIDLPAHSWALTQVMPELYDHASNMHSEDVGSYKNNTINPSLESTWNFLNNIIAEISDLFSFHIIHVGLDERPKSSWEGSPKIQQLMKEKNFQSFDEVQDYYMNRVINIIKKANKRTAAWNEAALSPHNDIGSSGGNGKIDKSCLIFAWEHPSVSNESAKRDFQTVICPGQKTYFDMAYNNATSERGICWAATIEASEIHSWKPLKDVDKNYHNLILGIQGQLWSETITKPEYIDTLINPRLACLSEVAWCSDNRRGWAEFKPTLLHNMKILGKLGWKYHDF